MQPLHIIIKLMNLLGAGGSVYVCGAPFGGQY